MIVSIFSGCSIQVRGQACAHIVVYLGILASGPLACNRYRTQGPFATLNAEKDAEMASFLYAFMRRAVLHLFGH
ncbi:hypothetical protein TH15_08240 [Thalassospira profundimaris]|nr:hypothetical protein TH15_08240 [Thalassospira profundimaris]